MSDITLAGVAAGHHGPLATQARDRRQLRIWLGVVILALFALVLVGGATRLTESGLSITEWKPIHGVIPPLTHAEWEQEFDLYKRIPQYSQLNSGMDLDGFKTIFWWEWAHRLLARSIGLIFALPLLAFWLKGKVEPRLKAPLLGILALGGFQGFVGWWMVSSGLVNRTEVSQYRLATHLTIACLIFAACVWIFRSLKVERRRDRPPTRHSVHVAALITVLALVQIYLGALVAGLDAGLSYNTWPLMDGALIPGDLFLREPAWINLFENPKTVQFVHRCGAYLLLIVTFGHMIASQALAPGSTHARGATHLAMAVLLQASIGVATLLFAVPIGLGVLHQAGALMVLAAAVMHWRGFLGSLALPGAVPAKG
ncbi:COX15/CtaA family protein [Rhizobium rhizosphaerae]|uniref:COX15/CtaA family protein n=1 Tax=Xaviernesmea rhizosphaerae TaxID=1672749 RepID=UPI0009BCBB27|nr:COX15/CtaA family protein [Xaviernesmea rhizosphaerae]